MILNLFRNKAGQVFTRNQLIQSKLFLIYVAGLVALAPLSIDAYMPVLPALAADFGVDMVAVNLTMSAYLIGMGIGQFLGGPLSDQLGRKPLGLTGVALFLVSTLLIINAGSIEQIQLLRVTQAIGGGFASVTCMAQIRDVFPAEQVGRKLANVVLVMLIAPMFAPTLGAILGKAGWRYIFVFLAVYSLIMLLLTLRLVPETHSGAPRQINLPGLFKGYGQAINLHTNGRRLALRFALLSALGGAIFMSYLVNAAFIFMNLFGLSEFEFAAVFFINGFMLMLGNRIAARFMASTAATKILQLAIGVQLSLLFTLVIISSLVGLSLWGVLAGVMTLMLISGAVSPTTSGAFISLYEHNIGSASSLNATLMFLFGGMIGALASKLSGGSLTPVLAVMLTCSALAFLVLQSIRAHSRQA